jgi:hypothetical protein
MQGREKDEQMKKDQVIPFELLRKVNLPSPSLQRVSGQSAVSLSK